jgi:hypothetical protein
MSVCVVLKVRSLDEDVEVEAVGGASVEVASEVVVGRLTGVESDANEDGLGRMVLPMVLMTCADLVGRILASEGVTGAKSALRTDWNEM